MPPLAILTQILTIIELSLRLMLDMPQELRQKHWENHLKVLLMLEDWGNKISKQIKDATQP